MTSATATADSGFLMQAWQTFVKPRGDRRWDVFIRATGLVALLGVPALLLFPDSATLVWLVVLSLPANSPLSPLLPTAFEPLIMEAAKWERVLPVTVVATAAYMYMEYVNWHVYEWVLGWERLASLRSRPSVRWGIRLFGRSPFWMVVVFAFTPMPFFAARALAILYRYPLPRFLLATLIGRAPRFLIYAWFGEALHVPTWLLVTVMFSTAALVIGSRLLRGVPLLAETAPPVDGAHPKA
jgi:membrane protein YqaA with SNARE-associated domain